MAISPTESYRLLYAQSPFKQSIAFLHGMRARFPSVEIPYLDVGDLPEEALESVDQYLYVRDDEDSDKVVSAVKIAAARGRAFPARLEDLGVVRGRDVSDMLDRFRTQQEGGKAEVGNYYRIQSGMYRNLIVRVLEQ